MFVARVRIALTTAVLGVALTACSSAGSSDPQAAGTGGAGTASASADGRLSVAVSFYPLQWTVERLAGGRAAIVDLTKPGVEPHDLELSPQEVRSVADARLVVYLSGFQPAVDKAIGATNAGPRTLDVASAARLDRTVADEEDASKTVRDPHFWLDPNRFADVVDAVAARLVTVDPAGAATYTANAKAVRADLTALDQEFAAGLARCANTDVVTSHEAFGYLAQRYGLKQVGISGLSPEQEPSPKTLASVSDFVKANKVRTVYYETLVPPDIAETVANATGAQTAVLDPIEGVTDSSAARDYLGIMRANLATLRKGQPCQ